MLGGAQAAVANFAVFVLNLKKRNYHTHRARGHGRQTAHNFASPNSWNNISVAAQKRETPAGGRRLQVFQFNILRRCPYWAERPAGHKYNLQTR
jgi:hypothetical protein